MPLLLLPHGRDVAGVFTEFLYHSEVLIRSTHGPLTAVRSYQARVSRLRSAVVGQSGWGLYRLGLAGYPGRVYDAVRVHPQVASVDADRARRVAATFPRSLRVAGRT